MKRIPVLSVSGYSGNNASVCVCLHEMSEYLTSLVCLIQDLPLKQSSSLNRIIFIKHLNES